MKKGFSRATPGPTINSFSPDCAEEAQREGDGNNILCVMEHLTINVNTYVRQNGPILFIGAALTHYYTSKREKSKREKERVTSQHRCQASLRNFWGAENIAH